MIPVMYWINKWRTPLPGGAKAGDIPWIVVHVHASVKNEKKIKYKPCKWTPY